MAPAGGAAGHFGTFHVKERGSIQLTSIKLIPLNAAQRPPPPPPPPPPIPLPFFLYNKIKLSGRKIRKKEKKRDATRHFVIVPCLAPPLPPDGWIYPSLFRPSAIPLNATHTHTHPGGNGNKPGLRVTMATLPNIKASHCPIQRTD